MSSKEMLKAFGVAGCGLMKKSDLLFTWSIPSHRISQQAYMELLSKDYPKIIAQLLHWTTHREERHPRDYWTDFESRKAQGPCHHSYKNLLYEWCLFESGIFLYLIFTLLLLHRSDLFFISFLALNWSHPCFGVCATLLKHGNKCLTVNSMKLMRQNTNVYRFSSQQLKRIFQLGLNRFSWFNFVVYVLFFGKSGFYFF